MHYHSHRFLLYLAKALSSPALYYSLILNVRRRILPWQTCPAQTCAVSPVFLPQSGTCGKHTGGWQLVLLHTCRKRKSPGPFTHTDEIHTTKGNYTVRTMGGGRSEKKTQNESRQFHSRTFSLPAVKVIPHVLWQHYNQVINKCCFVGRHAW